MKELRGIRLMQGAKSEPSAAERSLALKMLGQIEGKLGKSIGKATDVELNPYYEVIYNQTSPSAELDKSNLDDLLKSLREISPYALREAPSSRKTTHRRVQKKRSTVQKRRTTARRGTHNSFKTRPE